MFTRVHVLAWKWIDSSLVLHVWDFHIQCHIIFQSSFTYLYLCQECVRVLIFSHAHQHLVLLWIYFASLITIEVHIVISLFIFSLQIA